MSIGDQQLLILSSSVALNDFPSSAKSHNRRTSTFTPTTTAESSLRYTTACLADGCPSQASWSTTRLGMSLRFASTLLLAQWEFTSSGAASPRSCHTHVLPRPFNCTLVAMPIPRLESCTHTRLPHRMSGPTFSHAWHPYVTLAHSMLLPHSRPSHARPLFPPHPRIHSPLTHTHMQIHCLEACHTHPHNPCASE